MLMKFGDKTVDLMCLDTPESQHICKEVLTGKSYPIVPFAENVRVIVDIGANLGAASVYFSLYYPDAQIYAVEPQKFPFDILERNTGFYPNTKIFNVGLYNSNKESALHLSWADSSTASIGRSWLNTEKTEQIKLQDAAEWLQEQNITFIDILKIDTEGCEIPILSQLKHLIPKIQVIYVEYHSDADRRALDDLIGESHVLFSAKATRAHVGELVYVRADLGDATSELHKHRIKMPEL